MDEGEATDILNYFASPRHTESLNEEEQNFAENLQHKGFLVPPGLNELHYIREQIEYYKRNSVPGFGFLLTTECNFDCKYCYQQKSKKYMKEETALQFMDLIASTISTNQRKINVFFSGGEPLLQKSLIKTIITELSERFPQKEFYFGLTSNGSLLNQDFATYLGKHNWSYAQIPVNGPAESHNALSPDKNGDNTFSKVMMGLRNALKHCNKVVLRTNVDKTNEDKIESFWSTLKEEIGLRSILYLSPMKLGAPSHKATTRANQCFTCQDWADKHIYYQDLAHKLGFRTTIRLPRFQYCGLLGLNQLMFLPSGDITTCWFATSGVEKLIVGNIFQESTFNRNLETLRETNPLNFEKCKNCDRVTFCGGGCLADALVKRRSEGLEPCCPGYKKNFEDHVRQWVKYKMLRENHYNELC